MECLEPAVSFLSACKFLLHSKSVSHHKPHTCGIFDSVTYFKGVQQKTKQTSTMPHWLIETRERSMAVGVPELSAKVKCVLLPGWPRTQ